MSKPTRVTRKEFLGLGALMAGGIGCSGLPETEAQSPAEDDGRQPNLALINGHEVATPSPTESA